MFGIKTLLTTGHEMFLQLLSFSMKLTFDLCDQIDVFKTYDRQLPMLTLARWVKRDLIIPAATSGLRYGKAMKEADKHFTSNDQVREQ